MSSRKKFYSTPPLEPTQDYWQEFLKAHNIITEVTPTPTTNPTNPQEERASRDPQFLEYLKIASQYGAPKNFEEFKALSATDRQYYLNAYKIYLEEKKKMKL